MRVSHSERLSAAMALACATSCAPGITPRTGEIAAPHAVDVQVSVPLVSLGSGHVETGPEGDTTREQVSTGGLDLPFDRGALARIATILLLADTEVRWTVAPPLELGAEAGLSSEEIPLNRYDLYTADEVFLTGTAAEIVGVSKLDGRTIGAGGAGLTSLG